jgi:glycosyl transferase, family 25
VRTFIVNLKRRADRRQRLESSLPSILDAEFTTDWDGPLDGEGISAASLGGYGLFPWKSESANFWWNRPLKKGEVGCTISHLRCWERAVARGDRRFIVLEDDVIFVDGFTHKLLDGLARLDAIDVAWDLVYLGRVPIEPSSAITHGIVRPGYSHCTYGYALTLGGATKLLAAGLPQALIPIDEFLPAMYIDHPRNDVRRRYPATLAAYAFEPAIVLQLPKTIAGSDTEDSAFINWP